MSPLGEIRVINPQSRAVFSAYPTGLYNVEERAYQYRVRIPGVEVSLVTINVTEKELANFAWSNKPIPVKPAL